MARKKKSETQLLQATNTPIISTIIPVNYIELVDYERELIIKSFDLAAKYLPPCYYRDIGNIIAKLRN